MSVDFLVDTPTVVSETVEYIIEIVGGILLIEVSFQVRYNIL